MMVMPGHLHAFWLKSRPAISALRRLQKDLPPQLTRFDSGLLGQSTLAIARAPVQTQDDELESPAPARRLKWGSGGAHRFAGGDAVCGKHG